MLGHIGMPLSHWLALLEQRHPRAIDLSLERVARVREVMGLHPCFPIILVGGTNGKGSTCAYLEAILGEQGHKTGLYTSPHLLAYNERVRINGKDSDDDAITAGLAAVEAYRGDNLLTYFEHGTLGAVWQFMHESVGVAILEVGLGGRLDAVNVFDPAVSIVTSVDLDHQDWLGDNREAIGFEKAGIFRAARPAICADPSPPVSLTRFAGEIGADLQQCNRDFWFERGDGSWRFEWRGQTIADLPMPLMIGDHQIRNAAAALAGLMNLGDRLPVKVTAIQDGLRRARVSGRFQKVAKSPEVILDVAHNPEAARALASNLMAQPVRGRTFAVFALLADKDIKGVVAPLMDIVDVWHVCALEGPRALPVETLAGRVEGVLQAAPVARFLSPAEGLAAAARVASENDRILVFGSFHTVASVMAANPTWQLR